MTTLTYCLVTDEQHRNRIIEAALAGNPLTDDAGSPLRYVADVARDAKRFNDGNLRILRAVRDLGEPTYEDAMAALGYATDLEMVNDFMDRGILDLFTIGGTTDRRTLKVEITRIIYQIDI